MQELELLVHILKDKRLEEALEKMMKLSTDINYYFKRMNIKRNGGIGKQNELMKLDCERQVNVEMAIPSSDVEIKYHVGKSIA